MPAHGRPANAGRSRGGRPPGSLTASMFGELQTIGPRGVVLHSWESISRVASEDLWCSGRGPLVSPGARDRCILAMMRESVQLGVGVEAEPVPLREVKHQRPTSDPVLAQARTGGCEQATAPTHDPRGIDQSSGQSRPRRVVAIVKADVRRPDSGRAQRHGRERQRRPMLTIASTIHTTLAGRLPPTDARRQSALSSPAHVSGARFSRSAQAALSSRWRRGWIPGAYAHPRSAQSDAQLVSLLKNQNRGFHDCLLARQNPARCAGAGRSVQELSNWRRARALRTA